MKNKQCPAMNVNQISNNKAYQDVTEREHNVGSTKRVNAKK